MKRHGDSYYSNLLNSGDLHFHDEYISQATQDEQANSLSSQSELGSSQGNVQKRVCKCNFTSQEDLMLVSAWLNVSLDAITGTNQKHQTYWERVSEYFHEHKQFTSDQTANSLMHCWSVIQLAVGKFQGFFSQIEARNQSGTTEQDKIFQALELYKSIQKIAFSFIRCCHELRNGPKFSSLASSKKKSKNTETRSPTLTALSTPYTIDLEDNDTNKELSFEWLVGRKTAKKNEKKCKAKNVNFQNETREILLEIRQSQKQQREDRKAVAVEFLKIEKEREEREKRKDE